MGAVWMFLALLVAIALGGVALIMVGWTWSGLFLVCSAPALFFFVAVGLRY